MRVHDVAAHRQVCDALAAVPPAPAAGRRRRDAPTVTAARRARPRSTATPGAARPVYLVRGDDPSLVAPGRPCPGDASGRGRRPVHGGRGVRRPGHRPPRRRSGDRRLHHPAVPGRTPGGGGARRRSAHCRRCQAPGGLRRGPPGHHGAGAGGGGRHRTLVADQGGHRRRRGGRHLGGDGPGPVPVARRPSEGRPGPARRAGHGPALGATWVGTWGAWRDCSTPWPPAYGAGATVSVDGSRTVPGRGRSLAPWDLTDAIDAGRDRPGPGRARTGCWWPATPIRWW